MNLRKLFNLYPPDIIRKLTVFPLISGGIEVINSLKLVEHWRQILKTIPKLNTWLTPFRALYEADGTALNLQYL